MSCDVKGHTLTRHQPELGACPQNGFFGRPLASLGMEYGRSALKEGYRTDLSRGVDKSRWKAPSLKPDGRPFKPSNVVAGVPVGSLISWEESRELRSMSGIPEGRFETVRRSGQVWAACSKKPGAVWVAPDDGGSAVALCSKTLDVLR